MGTTPIHPPPPPRQTTVFSYAPPPPYTLLFQICDIFLDHAATESKEENIDYGVSLNVVCLFIA